MKKSIWLQSVFGLASATLALGPFAAATFAEGTDKKAGMDAAASRADRASPAGGMSAGAAGSREVTTTIASIDDDRLIVRRQGGAPESFEFASNVPVTGSKTNRSELKSGDRVKITYNDEGNRTQVESIEVLAS